MQDVRVSAENLSHATRTVYAETGRKVDLVGHSQGGMIGRWTTKWWPDTRAMVANMVGLGSSNNGSDMISLTCTVAYPEALRQQSGKFGLPHGTQRGRGDLPRHRLHDDRHPLR